MYKFVIKRLLITIPILIFVVFIIFSIMQLTPGDPGRMILGQNARQEAVEKLNHDLGYDQPFLIRFGNYIYNAVFKFDFGNSYRSGKPVINEILKRFPYTLTLSVLSIICSSLIGISIGVFAAVKQYSFLDNISTVLALFFSAIPGFWLGMMLMYVFSLKLKWFPTSGISSYAGFILPTLTLTIASIGGILRLTRSTMLETIRQDYIRTARAKGAPKGILIWKHALKNALLPIITVLGMNFGASLGGAVITETVFAIPGLGTYIVDAIRKKDIPIVLTSTVFLAALFCLIMLVVDIIYAYIDPRIKAKYIK